MVFKCCARYKGQTLLIANNKEGSYTLSDRRTWLSFNSKRNKIVCENLPPLFNQYGTILIDEKLNSKLNAKDAEIYIN